MNRFLILISSVFIFNMAFGAGAEVHFDFGNYTVSAFNSGEIYIEDGATVVGENGGPISIDYIGTVTIHNYGIINSQINNTNGHFLYVYNTGQINGAICGSNVTQRITNESELTPLNVSADDFTVQIFDYSNLDFNDIRDINATQFRVKNSDIVINDFQSWQTWDKNIVFEDDVNLIIDARTVQSGDIINNVPLDRVNIVFDHVDELFRVDLENVGYGFKINIVRETNNDAINDSPSNDTTGALETIRAKNPNDKLLMALDVANTSGDIDNIKNSSARFNHSVFLRPIIMLNNFAMANASQIHDNNKLGIDLSYVTSDSIGNTGGRLYFASGYKSTAFDVGFNFNSFNFDDNVNDFSGVMYGTDARVKHRFDNYWVDGAIGVNWSKYDGDYITADDKLENNPRAKSGYVVSDFGYDIMGIDKIKLSPFIGLLYQKYNVLDAVKSNANIRLGANAEYDFVIDDIEYEYSLSGAIYNNYDMFIKCGVGFNAIADKIGAALGFGVFKNEYDTYYKLSGDVKIIF